MQLTHFDENGKAIMVDVTEKNDTVREATAKGRILVSKEVYDAIEAGTVGKGDVLGVATTAGIMGAKRTSELIPMCHPLPIQKCSIDYELDHEKNRIHVFCTVKTEGKTGVEMEALTGVQVTLLTIYDMCKAIDDMMQDSREEGKAEGRTEGILFALTGLVRDGVLSIKDAAFRANMTESAFEAAMKKI